MVEAFPPALDILGQQLKDSGVRNIASIVAPSVSQKPDLFEGVWYTDSNLTDPAFRARFEAKYPDTRFATHMMPYAYDHSVFWCGGSRGGSISLTKSVT